MTTTVRHNEALHRYESEMDGQFAGYTNAIPQGDVIVFPHTEILPAFAGHGLATILIRAALDDVRARGLKMRAVCPFVADFLDKHPEYQDLAIP